MRKILAVIALLLFAIVPAFSQQYSREGFSMNTVIRMSVTTDNKDLVNQGYDLLDELDRTLSMYNPSSDISSVNHGETSSNPHVIRAVREAVRVYDITGGVFNPLIGAVTNLWKINNREGTVPTKEALQEAISLSHIDNIVFSDGTVSLKTPGSVLDLGGLAKGYASDVIADFFRTHGVTSGLLDFGGNVYVIGRKADGTDWRIGIRDPENPQGVAVVLSVHDTAVITSGGYERFKIIDGKRYTHFFDPKTGESVNSDLLSATLITPDGSLADGLATAFMIMGAEKSIELLQKMENAPMCVLVKEGSILASKELQGMITRSRYEVTYF